MFYLLQAVLFFILLDIALLALGWHINSSVAPILQQAWTRSEPINTTSSLASVE